MRHYFGWIVLRCVAAAAAAFLVSPATADSYLTGPRASFTVHNETGATLSIRFEREEHNRSSGLFDIREWTRFDLAPWDIADVDIPTGRVVFSVKPTFLPNVPERSTTIYRSPGSPSQVKFLPSDFNLSIMEDPGGSNLADTPDPDGAAIRAECAFAAQGQAWTHYNPHNTLSLRRYHRSGNFICGDKGERAFILKGSALEGYRCASGWTDCSRDRSYDGTLLEPPDTQDVTMEGRAVTIYRYPFSWTNSEASNWIMSIHN